MLMKLMHKHHLPLIRRAMVAAGQATASQRVSLVAAGCAFYATLALFPTITMLISFYGLLYNPDTVQPQLQYLQTFMPPAVFSLISDRIQSLVEAPAQGLGLSFVISLVISFWSATTGTKSVLNALSMAYHEREERGIVKFQLISLGMTLVAVIGAAMAVGLLVFIPFALAFLGVPGDTKLFVNLLSSAAMIFFVLMALGLVYRFGPAGGNRIFYAPGAGIATVLWLLVSWAFGFYVGHFAVYNVTYGPLSTLIGLMMWFYLSAYVVLFGAEVNAAMDREWKRSVKHAPAP
jgi:membrane protein